MSKHVCKLLGRHLLRVSSGQEISTNEFSVETIVALYFPGKFGPLHLKMRIQIIPSIA